MKKRCGNWFLLGLWGAASALGCASAPYRPAGQPGRDSTPPDVGYHRGTIAGSQGLKLLEQCWLPTRPSRASVVLVHDLKDHSGRYRDLGISLANRGISLCAMDLRGHGYSEGVRDHIDSLESGLQDLELLVTRVREREKDKPIFVLGQGFGATLAGLYAVRAKTPPAGIILSNPMLREGVKRSERIGTRAYAIFLPHSQRLEIDLHRMSNEPRVVDSLLHDALIFRGKATATTAGELIRASDELSQHATEINVPLLVLMGGGDQISQAAPVKALHEKAATSDKKLQTYETSSHSLFHESARMVVINDVSDWIAAHSEEPEQKAPEPTPAPELPAEEPAPAVAEQLLEKAAPPPAKVRVKKAAQKTTRRR